MEKVESAMNVGTDIVLAKAGIGVFKLALTYGCKAGKVFVKVYYAHSTESRRGTDSCNIMH